MKFVERKKADRRLKKALASGDSESIAEAAVDCCYIKCFPKIIKYISLYPDLDTPPTDVNDESEVHDTAENRNQIRQCIRDYLDERNLLTKDIDENFLDAEMENQLNTELFKKIDWLERKKWNKIVMANRQIYEMAGLDYKQVLKNRLESKGDDIQLNDISENVEQQDEFFCEGKSQENEKSVSKLAIEGFTKTKF